MECSNRRRALVALVPVGSVDAAFFYISSDEKPLFKFDSWERFFRFCEKTKGFSSVPWISKTIFLPRRIDISISQWHGMAPGLARRFSVNVLQCCWDSLRKADPEVLVKDFFTGRVVSELDQWQPLFGKKINRPTCWLMINVTYGFMNEQW